VPPSAQSHQAELLTAAVRAFLNPAELDALARLARSFHHWDGLIAEADWHRVSPILCRVLETLPAGLIPDGLLHQLRALNANNSFRSLVILGELRRLSELFEANRIPIAAFKGPVLAVANYGDPGLRRFNDLDILVPPDQVWRARDLLAAEGYRLYSNLDWCGEPVYLLSHQELSMMRGVVAVDLHWRLFGKLFPYRFDLPELWQRRGTVVVAGRSVPVLSAEHQLLYLAAHGAKHYWAFLGWICDFARFLQTTPLDWARVFRLAKSAGNPLVLAHALALAQDFAGVAIPPEAQEWMHASRRLAADSHRIASRVAKFILSAGGESPIATRRGLLFYCELSSGPLGLLRMFHALSLPTEEDWKILHLPPALYPLYYPFRFLRLLTKYGLRQLSGRRA
jgi:hypothetical protein